ncbi:MAG TPA: transcriptional regulator, partial [Deltaproteobacteria bacterium]|nr:transcriptional regulator [Deltaproteobacteria bacterium]
MKGRNPASQFLSFIREGESEKIEFKESFNREALETLCAFANTKGGALLIGVRDKGNIVGVSASQKALGEWANQIDQGIGIHPSMEKKKIKDKEIVLIRVKESRHKPVLYRGRAYQRVGNSTRQMNGEKLTRTILEGVGATWDELPEPRATISDIDPAQTKAFIRLANQVGRRSIPENTPVKKLLDKLNLFQKNRLTRAAILLFGKQPQSFYRQAMIKAGRFKSETLILDDREMEGTLLDQVENTMTYFRERLQTRFEMTGKPQRNVVWEYPLEALREALVNAVCHRDYMESGHTQIRLYDDRLLIWNPGNLPDDLSVEMLKREHRSVPRNRLIAKVFFYAGLIEQWGSGVAKMISTTRALGLPEPIFEEKDGFKVIFGAPPHVTPHV